VASTFNDPKTVPWPRAASWWICSIVLSGDELKLVAEDETESLPEEQQDDDPTTTNSPDDDVETGLRLRDDVDATELGRTTKSSYSNSNEWRDEDEAGPPTKTS
jgi:hypothetical protein